jgi:hypothetical protein
MYQARVLETNFPASGSQKFNQDSNLDERMRQDEMIKDFGSSGHSFRQKQKSPLRAFFVSGGTPQGWAPPSCPPARRGKIASN